MSRFLLAHLHLQAVGQSFTPNAVRKALQALPQEIHATSEEAMQRVERQDREAVRIGLRVLMWICLAQRPLTGQELQHAIAMDTGTGGFGQADLIPLESLLDVCLGLVISDEKTKIFRLVHYTAQVFLESEGLATYFQDGHSRIAKACLSYLCVNKPLTSDSFPSVRLRHSIDENFPLLPYATRYSGHHVSLLSSCDLEKETTAFLNIDPHSASIAFCAYERASRRDYHDPRQAMQVLCMLLRTVNSSERTNVPPLILAALFGLDQTVLSLLEQGFDVNEIFHEVTPLSATLCSPRPTTTLLLLKHGADISNCLWSVLHLATSQENDHLLELAIKDLQKRNEVLKPSYYQDLEFLYPLLDSGGARKSLTHKRRSFAP